MATPLIWPDFCVLVTRLTVFITLICTRKLSELGQKTLLRLTTGTCTPVCNNKKITFLLGIQSRSVWEWHGSCLVKRTNFRLRVSNGMDFLMICALLCVTLVIQWQGRIQDFKRGGGVDGRPYLLRGGRENARTKKIGKNFSKRGVTTTRHERELIFLSLFIFYFK